MDEFLLGLPRTKSRVNFDSGFQGLHLELILTQVVKEQVLSFLESCCKGLGVRFFIFHFLYNFMLNRIHYGHYYAHYTGICMNDCLIYAHSTAVTTKVYMLVTVLS